MRLYQETNLVVRSAATQKNETFHLSCSSKWGTSYSDRTFCM